MKRKDVAEAVEEFILADVPRTKAGEGQRAQLSSEYARIHALRLRRFAKAFPAHAVCDLSKDHLDAFIHSLDESGAKSRNQRSSNGSSKLQRAGDQSRGRRMVCRRAKCQDKRNPAAGCGQQMNPADFGRRGQQEPDTVIDGLTWVT